MFQFPFFIAIDTSNIGTEIVPKIWSATVDSITNRIIVGSEVASSFVPFFVNNSSLGQKVSLMLDLISLLNGFNAGKYIVGFESTLLNPNGKSLLIGRDSVAERLQPLGTSFVYFGRDTNSYPINHLPFIGLNFELPAIGGSGLPTSGCNTLYLGISALTVQFKIYPIHHPEFLQLKILKPIRNIKFTI
ncbi:hypothetical protein N9Q47_00430 [Vicingaceae bacterium]|nr:hypothetical protein [Vicingaceae bacterium]